MRRPTTISIALGLLALAGCSDAGVSANPEGSGASTRQLPSASAVQNLVATQDGAGLDLTWDAAPNATSYEVFYGLTDDLAVAASAGASTVTCARLSPLDANTAYWVWVRAASVRGASDSPGAFASVPAQTGE